MAIAVALAAGCSSDGPVDQAAGLDSAGASGAVQARHVGASSYGEEILNQDPSVQYLGRDACRDCHRELFSSFVRTGMGRSLYDMTEDEAVEAWTAEEGDNVYTLASQDISYRMEKREDGFYQRQYVTDSHGNELAGEERKMRFIVGSNNHNRCYMHVNDGRLYQAPVCWYPQAQKWDMCPGFEHDNNNFTREISASCMFCHNDRMVLVDGERNMFEEVPLGIGCERCHGPGELHVAKWKGAGAGETGSVEERDTTIVHPRWLDPTARLHVCAQCHLGDAKQTERVRRDDRNTIDYRPGELLTDYVMPFRYAKPSEAEFGLSAQVDRMVLSKCYLESNGEFDCLRCHDPHVSIYSPSRPPDYFKQKCMTCHASEDCEGPEHMRAATDGVADDCVSCHMRKAEPDDQRFTEFTDHWIRKSIDVEHHEREDYTIEPTFPELLARFDKGEQAFLWARAHYRYAGKEPKSSRIQLEAAVERFEEAIREGYRTSSTWYFLGKAQQDLGQHGKALTAFRQVLAQDPDHHDANFALGQMLAGMGKISEAKAIFDAMLLRDPEDAMALAEVGRILFNQGDHDRALAIYRKAVSLEPMNSLLHLNLGMTLAATGRMEDAAQVGIRLAGMEPDDESTWHFFHNVMRETGRQHESREGLERLQHTGGE